MGRPHVRTDAAPEPGDEGSIPAYCPTMARSGWSAFLPSASFPAVAGTAVALSLGVVAAACWVWAGLMPVEATIADGGTLQVRWWSLSIAAVGIVSILLLWTAGRVGGRAGIIVVAAMLIVLVVGAIRFWWVLPKPTPIRPLGPAAPYAMAGFAAAAAACVVLAVSILLTGATSRGPGAPANEPNRPLRSRTAVTALCLAAVVAVAAGWLVVERSRGFLLAANEYRTVGDLDQASVAPTSALTGGDSWQVEVPGFSLARPAVTDFGLAVASGDYVIMVDRATGEVRWRYTRSDVGGPVVVAGTGGGRQVLVRWGHEAVFVLDARTGERVGDWRPEDGETILDPALPLVARRGPEASTTILRVSPTGSGVWAYDLRPCEAARGTLAGTVVVVTTTSTCSQASRVVGLDPETGRELWSSTMAADLRGVAGGAGIMLTAADAGGDQAFTAVDLHDGRTRWSHPLPHHDLTSAPCQDQQVAAAGRIAVLVCSWDVTDYPLGPEKYSSTGYAYDASTGALLNEFTPDSGPIIWTAVAADGRILVARTNPWIGWVLDVVVLEPGSRTVTLDPVYLEHHAALRTLTAVGDQVLVLDAGHDTLRSLR